MLRYLNFFEDLGNNETTVSTENDGTIPPAATASQGGGGGKDFNRRAVVLALAALLVVTTGFLLYNILPLLISYVRRKIPVSKKKIERRYRTIEQWTVTKTVHAHGVACNALQRMERERLIREASSNDIESSVCDKTCCITFTTETAPDKVYSIKAVASESDESGGGDNPEKECSICLEPFVPGTQASWSVNEECSHVFHPDCIKDWLLRRTECPYCRRLFMPVDCTTNKLSQSVLKEMARERKRRWGSTYYCEKHGLCVAGPFNLEGDDKDKTKEKRKSSKKKMIPVESRDDSMLISIARDRDSESERCPPEGNSTQQSTDGERPFRNMDIKNEKDSISVSSKGRIDDSHSVNISIDEGRQADEDTIDVVVGERRETEDVVDLPAKRISHGQLGVYNDSITSLDDMVVQNQQHVDVELAVANRCMSEAIATLPVADGNEAAICINVQAS